MTQEDLRKAAVRWLTNSQKCGVVLSEMVTAAREIPDAIGWKSGVSYLIECKVSRADFRRNEDKCFIRNGSGMGCRRFFLCPRDLITAEDLEGSDYGLLWIGESGTIRLVRQPETREGNARKEICMLTSALRRVRTREFLTINAYCQDALSRARGLCINCYRYHQRHGTLDQFCKVDERRGRPKKDTMAFTGAFPKIRLRLRREDVFSQRSPDTSGGGWTE